MDQTAAVPFPTKLKHEASPPSEHSGVRIAPPLPTSTPTEMTAAQRVLGTPELVDLILCCLTPATLLRCAIKVCRAWWHVIEHPSLDLQIALWLRPRPGPVKDVKYEYGEGEENFVFNDLLSNWINKWDLDDGTLMNVSLSVDELPWRKFTQAWKGNEERWRNILVSHPPIPRISITKRSVRLKELPCSTGVQGFLLIPEGLRLGLLKGLIEDWYVSIKHPELDSKIRRERVGTGWCREFGALRDG
ncbi:hypothetical protein BDZ45DRAFT_681285 [Acephala macrosclerotiorum]|nr:hypothetical protein BDZ45DRAFT_681285 [Acephala macrosclerotiorum]